MFTSFSIKKTTSCYGPLHKHFTVSIKAADVFYAQLFVTVQSLTKLIVWIIYALVVSKSIWALTTAPVVSFYSNGAVLGVSIYVC